MVKTFGVESSEDDFYSTTSSTKGANNNKSKDSGVNFSSSNSNSSFVCPVCFLPYVCDDTLKLHLKSHKQHTVGPGPSFFSSLYGSPTKILPASPAPPVSQHHAPLLKRLQPENFFCSSCSAGFPTLYLLSSHAEQCVGTGKNKKTGGRGLGESEKCREITKDADLAHTSSQRNSEEDKKYFCELCQHVRRGKKTILKHFRASHPDFFFCIGCNKAIQRSAFATHSCNIGKVIEIGDSESESSVSQDCTDSRSNSAAGNRAASSNSTKSSGSSGSAVGEPAVAVVSIKKFLCRACKLQFLRPLDFLSHLHQQHNEKKLFPCPFCRLQFDSFELLDVHECSKAM